MSIAEILAELPKLQSEERYAILKRIEELESLDDVLIAAMDEAEASSREEYMTIEQVRERMKQWTHIK